MIRRLVEMFRKGGSVLGKSLAEKNIRELTAALENRKNVLGRHPLNIQIQTVSTCNATCYFCPYPESWQKENPGRMAEEVYRKIIDEVSQYKVGKFCPYLENEPLMDPRIFERIEYGISRLDFKVLEMATNASLLNKNKLEDIVRIFPQVNNQIWISFHGINKETFGTIMGLDFDTCKANVLALIEKAQNHNLTILLRGGGMPRVQTGNLPEWFTKEQYLNFWGGEFKKHGFKKLPNIGFFTYHDRAGQISRNEINFAWKARPNLKGFYCVRIDQWAHFLYTGELILCCMDYHHQTVYGDITKQSLNEIYTSEAFLTIAKQVIGKAVSADDFICKRCVSPGG